MTSYTMMMSVHSLLRWLAVALLLFSVFKSLTGLFGNLAYTSLDKWLALGLVVTMYLQLFTGLALYFFLSPLTKLALMDFGGAMKDPELRFWGLEHFMVMMLAVAAVQIGHSISRRSEDSLVKYRFQSIFHGVAVLLVFIAIPWTRL